MNCASIQNQLVDYLQQELPAAEQAALAAHLATCPACQAELDATQRVWQALGQAPVPEPSAQLRPEFYAMLATFSRAPAPPTGYSFQGVWHWLRALPLPRPVVRLAYSAGLLGIGALGGYWLHLPKSPAVAEQQQVSALAAQVSTMRQVLLLTLLDNPSATERLRAVGYTKELPAPNARVVEALLSTLNQDTNVNVRLAALEALAPLAHDPMVRLGLVHALPRQTSPLVQVALADAMAQLREQRSVAPLRDLLKQADLDATVKSKIEQTIQVLSTGRPAAPTPSPSHEDTSPTSRPVRAVTFNS
jgi:hypothetical protein